MLIEGRGAPAIARACAILSERHVLPGRSRTTDCDLLSATDDPAALPPHVQRVARDLGASVRARLDRPAATVISDTDFRRAVLAAYPDRAARRRAPNSDRFVLASGTGARLARESGVRAAEYVVAVDVTAGGDVTGVEALIRIATAVEREWLVPTANDVRHVLDAGTGAVKATRVEMFGELVLSEHPIAPDPGQAAALVATAYARRGPSEQDQELLRRAAFAGLDLTFAALVERAAAGAKRLADVNLGDALAYDENRLLDQRAPATLAVPSGRRVKLAYGESGAVTAAVKLQELFGLAESPRIGQAGVPVTFVLLAPSGRPVQVTSDLRSFWTRGYPEVRKELRARYPKHPWPDDPWTARPTARTTRRPT